MKLAVLQRPADVTLLNDWLREHCRHAAILISNLDRTTRHNLSSACPCFALADILGPHSQEIDDIYREILLLRTALYTRFEQHKVLGVPWIEDMFNAARIQPYTLWAWTRAARALFDQHYDEVVIVTEALPYYFNAVLDEARAAGIEVIGDGFLEFRAGQGWVPCLHAENEGPLYLEAWGKEVLAKSGLAGFSPWARLRDLFKAKADADDLLVLVTTTTSLHLNNLIPVLKEVDSRDARYQLLTTIGGAETALREAGFKPVELDSLPVSKAQVGLVIASLRSFVAALHSWVFEQDIAPAAGYSSATPMHILRAMFKRPFHRQLFFYGLNVVRLNNQLQRHRPRMLYKIPNGFSTMDGAHRVLSDAAGIISATALSAPVLLRHRQWGVAPSDYILVAGDFQIEPLTGGGYLEAQIKVVGQPELDAPMRTWTGAAARDYLVKTLPGIDPAQTIITVVSSGVAADTEQLWFRQLITLTEIHPSLTVILKLHPRLAVNGYAQWRDQHPAARYFVTNDSNVYPYLAAADLVCTDLSQAARFAVCFDKPILSVNLTGEEYLHNRLDEYGVADLVTSLEALTERVQAYLIDRRGDEQQRQHRGSFIRTYFTAADGHAAQRAADFLLAPPHKQAFAQLRTKPLWWVTQV